MLEQESERVECLNQEERERERERELRFLTVSDDPNTPKRI